MNKTTGIVIGVVAVVLIASAAYTSSNKARDVMMDAKTDEVIAVEDKGAMMKDGGADTMDTTDEIMKAGSYEAYAPEKLARAEKGDVVLFFHASWCPSCRALGADIEKNLGAIPSGLSILKVDYDTESELKKKYGVTYQHTLVQVSSDGAMIKKWSGSPTLKSLASQVN